jgi:hypothetical protein
MAGHFLYHTRIRRRAKSLMRSEGFHPICFVINASDGRFFDDFFERALLNPRQVRHDPDPSLCADPSLPETRHDLWTSIMT